MPKSKKKIICIDLDNTICRTRNNDYKNSKPIKQVISLINNLYEKGHIIKIFTARYMGRSGDNRTKAIKLGYKKTIKQLIAWKVKFHILIMGKPSYDILIDDKAIGFNRKWFKSFKL